MNIIICDTCSLIKLEKGDAINILEQVYDKIYLPEAVENECKGTTKKLIQKPFFKIIKVSQVLPIGMGLGEREAISLGVELNIKKIITDDKKAFKNSIRYGLKPRTSFQFLVMAKYLGYLQEVKPILDKIIKQGDGIDQGIYDQTLIEAQEFKKID